MLLEQKNAIEVLSRTKVIARASPEQKAKIVACLKSHGKCTLMCGDGTNDVGALKQAHVGIALINDPKQEKSTKEKDAKEMQEGEEDGASGSGSIERKRDLKERVVDGRGPPKGTKVVNRNPNRKKKEEQLSIKQMKKKMYQEQRKRMEKMKELSEDNIVQFGDASTASPFTSKSSSVLPVTHIIRQGRCTLVTTMQMFRILAINCLISAYGLSVLYLDGIKLGDVQATVMGLLTTFCFLFITRSEPLPELSSKRPIPNIFNLYMVSTVVTQFLIHLSALIYVVAEVQTYHKGPRPDLDAEFTPNMVNSAVFLLMSWMQVTTFAVNHQGHPFMDSITENLPLLGSLTACILVTSVTALELIPSFNALFQLVPLNPHFRGTLLQIMVADSFGTYAVDRIFRFLFT
eukprot:TRINITY_DN6896_c0_g1_i9.p1 TRINITY_DN6896_c0_g1~~TRINITY_DN6896_c0_g1_i9.p1  ORF type:complete len:404 (+),score=113.57 TRINITY_DN6896_c0_g1_i9:315-1526(+)